MNYTTVKASKPGQPLPKLEKRTSDSKIFQIDCTELLALGELIFGEPTVKPVQDLEITEVVTRQGKYIQFRASKGPVNMPFVEYQVKFVVATTAQNSISVPVIVKVYSD